MGKIMQVMVHNLVDFLVFVDGRRIRQILGSL